MNTLKNKIKLAYCGFAFNFLVGALAMVLGSSLLELVNLYDRPLEKVVLLGSSMAIGRVLGSAFFGKLVEKVNPLKVEIFCSIMIILFLLIFPRVPSMGVGMILSFIEGVSFSGNDAFSPLLIAYVFRERYSSALSFGQALYGLGGFLVSFLIMLTIRFDLPFYYAYYVLAFITMTVLVVSLFTKYDVEEVSSIEQEKVIPLYSKSPVLSYVLIFVMAFSYCAICNIIGTYCTSYSVAVGIDEQLAAAILSVYNVGCVVGAIVFIPILKKVQEKTVLVVNFAIGLAAMAICVFMKNAAVLDACMFIAGFFLGVLFAVILAISTRVGYKHLSLASSLVGISGGIGDITVPIITSWILKTSGIIVTYRVVVDLLIVELLVGILLAVLTSNKEVSK